MYFWKLRSEELIVQIQRHGNSFMQTFAVEYRLAARSIEYIFKVINVEKFKTCNALKCMYG